ncbi:MAG: hypothetical protein NT069_33020 [Planctomycetota bacterium]|nr:hypothetical protein [Planctomycetota bacterium]
MPLAQLVRQHYPQAQRLREFRASLLERLGTTVGATTENTLLGTSLCADDILATKDITHTICGPFNTGGLAGLPFGGRTAITAFLHHIPENGVGLLVHGPHVGIARDGTIGKLRRAGQSHDSTCCGSLMAAIAQLKAGPAVMPDVPPDPDDMEQSLLVRLLSPYRDRILTADSPEREVTDVAYEVGQGMIERLVAATRTQLGHGGRLVCIGIVVINTAPGEEDWIDLRAFREV